MRLKLTIVVCITFGTGQLFAQNILTLPFDCISDKIILKVRGKGNDTLNIFFDTGADFMYLDSSLAAGYELFGTRSLKVNGSYVLGARMTGRLIPNPGIFKDSILNIVYGNIVTQNYITHHPNDLPIRLDGMMGIGSLRKYVVLLDFEKKLLTIKDKQDPYTDKTTFTSIKMLNSDDGHSTPLSNRVHTLGSTRVKLCLSKGHVIEATGMFDTGCFRELVLCTTMNLDSIRDASEPKCDINIRYDSMQQGIRHEYCFNLDSATLGSSFRKTGQKAYAINVDESRFAKFGEVSSYILIGFPFFRKFKRVYLNYPAARIDLEQ